MEKKDYKIHIIGAGISGLIAAINLEKAGYAPTILEASKSAGGRVKTDVVQGYQLDHGFQVLLDGYPMAQKYLDYEALRLQRFKPGATIYLEGKTYTIGDPLRDGSLFWSTLTAKIGTLADKWKIFKLNQKLAKKSIHEIFEDEEVSTLAYLKRFGFSDTLITCFFKPFFAGIFLESDLTTSSRMFEFVYKMFGTGYATLPEAGIAAVALQLKNQLRYSELKYHAPVTSVTNDRITLASGEELESHATIIATDAAPLVTNLRNQPTVWKSCDTLYFEVDKRTITAPLIGLIADDNALINNIFYHDSLGTAQKGAASLLSVTVVKDHQLTSDGLIHQVQSELSALCHIDQATFLKQYTISRALPELSDIRYDCAPSETQLTDRIFLAGDHLLNGSLNAAMLSGERAAQGLLQTLEGGIRAEGIVSDSLL